MVHKKWYFLKSEAQSNVSTIRRILGPLLFANDFDNSKQSML